MPAPRTFRSVAAHTGPLLAASLLAASLLASPSLSAPADARIAHHYRWRDFNGDGFADLAIGIPDRNVGGMAGAGAVLVLYGSADGLSSTGRQLFNESSAELAGAKIAVAATGDHFGAAVTSGDFDGDGFADLAIGSPGWDDVHSHVLDVGAIAVLWGSANGLQGPPEELVGTVRNDHLGGALVALDMFHRAAPDLKRDGIADLGFTGATPARATVVAGGTRTFLSHPIQSCHQAVGSSGAFALARGNIDSNPLDELLIGQPNEPAKNAQGNLVAGVGTVSILNCVAGVGACASSTVTQRTFGGTNEAGDHFGSAIVTAHLSSSSSAESMLVGVPGKDVDFGGRSLADAGMVMTITGHAGTQTTEASPGVPGEPRAADNFGAALTVGRFDGGSAADVAIGVPGALVSGGFTHGGAVVILRSGSPSLLFTQESSGIEGSAANNDRFGTALTAADFGFTGRSDLAIGVPFHNATATVLDSGQVNVLYGSASGLSGSNDQMWSLDTTGIPGDPTPYEHFGAALR